MIVAESIEALRAARASMPGRVGAVLTMGALHDGHLALVRTARAENDHVAASIFVNPMQFREGEDFSAYPRTLDRDLMLLEAEGVDVVFTPTPAMMYPPGFQTYISVPRAARGLEGAARPGHFRGVATVVNKLFNLIQPRISYFGQKDAQQVVVIRTMVRDLDLPVEIAVMPTTREPDGLAMSSRNVYLSPEERLAAASIPLALEAVGARYEAGKRASAHLRAAAEDVLRDAPGAHIEYLAFNDPRTLAPVRRAGSAPLLFSLAVRLGQTRLLDNMLLPAALNNRHDLTQILGGAPSPGLR